MRRGTNDAVMFIEDGDFKGVSLGWDFTAEHEWGINGIKQDFGLREVTRGGRLSKILGRDVIGIEARRIQRVPKMLKLTTKGDLTYLISARLYGIGSEENPSKKDLDRSMDASSYGDDEIQGAWDEGSFGVRVTSKENRKYLKELFAAFEAKDVIITFGSKNPKNPFSGSGLMLLIVSKLPQSYIDEQAEADIDRLNLVEAAEKTGIAERLKDAGRRYFALSPKWEGHIKSTKNGEIKTKHSVIFWLNPQEQDIHNAGWFTVETLDEWVNGKGIIMKETA